MSASLPIIVIECDNCGHATLEFELEEGERGEWSDEGLGYFLNSEGWRIEGETHYCPDCDDDMRAVPDEKENEDGWYGV